MRNYIPTTLIVLLAAMLLIISSPNNLGITPDSVNYIEAAKNITNGDGYTISGDYITHWPPVYSILLSLVNQFSGVSILNLGKYINSFFFIILGFSYRAVLNEINFSKPLSSFILSVLLVSTPLTISLFFWSELPFITYITLSFYYFLRWKKNFDKKLLITAGCFGLLALMTRYAAVGLLIGFIINLLFFKHRNFRNKLFDIIYFSLPLLLGSCIWIYYALTHATSTIGRSITVNLISFDKILSACSTMKSWLITGRLSQMSFTIIVILVTMVTYKHRSQLKSYLNNTQSTIIQITTVIVSYLFFLLLSISLFDSHTPLDNRILSPIAPFLVILIGYIINFISASGYKKYTVITAVLLMICSLSSSKHIWNNHYKNGNGFTSKKFSEYTTIINKYVFTHKGDTYTNGDDLIMLTNTSHSNILSIPQKFNPVTKEVNNNYTKELTDMKKNMSVNNAQIIYFDNIDWRWYLTNKERLLNLNSKNQVIDFKNGFIIKSLSK